MNSRPAFLVIRKVHFNIHIYFYQQLLTVETWTILIMEMLTSAVQRLVPRQLTAVMMVSPSLEMKSVSVRPMGNGQEKHQSANVSDLLLIYVTFVSSGYELKASFPSYKEGSL